MHKGPDAGAIPLGDHLPHLVAPEEGLDADGDAAAAHEPQRHGELHGARPERGLMGCGASAKKYESTSTVGAAAPPGSTPHAAAASQPSGKPAASEPAQPAEAPAPAQPAAGPARKEEDPEEAEELAEDEDNTDWLELDTQLEGADLDLDGAVTRREWIKTMTEVGMDKGEAGEMYDHIAAEALEEGTGSPEGGVPLREFMDELKIEIEDRDALKAIARAVAAAKEKLAAEGDEAGLKTASDALARCEEAASGPAACLGDWPEDERRILRDARRCGLAARPAGEVLRWVFSQAHVCVRTPAGALLAIPVLGSGSGK